MTSLDESVPESGQIRAIFKLTGKQQAIIITRVYLLTTYVLRASIETAGDKASLQLMAEGSKNNSGMSFYKVSLGRQNRPLKTWQIQRAAAPPALCS